MPEDNNVGGANNQQAGGDADKVNQTKSETVTREAYERLLDDHKKMKSKLEKIDADKKAAEEQALKDQNKWKEYAETKEKEANEFKTKLAEESATRAKAMKIAAVLKALPGEVSDKYYGHIDTDLIKVHPETGIIDEASLRLAVDNFKKEYPEIIRTKSGTHLPNNAPNYGGAEGTITYSKWKALGSSKEMNKYKKSQIIMDS